ncbi:MAG: T9SS type A sorting domain-containing protein [Cryomorphaceae bacterium]|jgi:hypothetical protein|nr:T9SS type A sorting domain-containing protein [Cryomorphaceae bacterium]
MKTTLLIAALFMTVFSQAQLTYIPDDAFELFAETYVPGASNGISNDNYVNTDALNNYYGVSMSGVMSFDPQSIPTAVISDFTGLEDFTSIYYLFITSMSITQLNISNLSNVYAGNAHLSVNISNCNILQEISLPQNNISVNISNNPFLEHIQFQNSNVFYGTNLIQYNNSLKCIDISNTAGVNNQAWFTSSDNLLLESINLKNGQCNKWVSVSVQNACLVVDDITYAQVAWFGGNPSFFNVTLSSSSCSSCVADMSVMDNGVFNVYPNPTTGSVSIESAEHWNNEVYELYDQSGRKLLSGVLSGTQSTIQLPFGSGMYYLKISDEVVKVVKE